MATTANDSDIVAGVMDDVPAVKSGRPKFEGVSAGRRRNMQANGSKNTKPEMVVRRLLHAKGYRYTIHSRDLPGKPDIAFRGRLKAIEVRGCFWHGHGCYPIGQLPKSRTEYWGPKIAATRERDVRNIGALQALGWRVLEVWECRVRAMPDKVVDELIQFLGPRVTPRWRVIT